MMRAMEEEEEEQEEEVKDSSSVSRWNPTRDQVLVLEGMYREGMLTPNAEEIQEIARRLKVFGPAEGKNVFYWFQNHKARQRQKRKQEERFSILTHLRRQYQPMPMPMPMPMPVTPMPFYPRGRTNGLFAPYPYGLTVPQAGASSGFYNQTQLPNVYFPRPVKMVPKQASNNEAYASMHLHPGHCLIELDANHESVSPETLQLFPLHPSGTRPDKFFGSSLAYASVEDGEDGEGGGDNVPFFNFFGPSEGSN